MSQLICKNLLVGYEGKAILDPLNFEIHAGGYLCVVGENGAGKSTLMKTLLGLQQPISGQIEMGDGLRRNEIGYLPQQTIVQRDFQRRCRKSCCLAARAVVDSAHFTVGRKSSLRRMPCAKCRSGRWQMLLPGAFRRSAAARLAGARPLRYPEMLLLDEPVSGLDPKVTTEMYHLIEN